MVWFNVVLFTELSPHILHVSVFCKINLKPRLSDVTIQFHKRPIFRLSFWQFFNIFLGTRFIFLEKTTLIENMS